MKCKKCGNETKEKDNYCPKCGHSMNNNDRDSVWYLILGLFFPLIATILYCFYSGTKPKTSKKLMIGFIIGYMLSIIKAILLFFLFFSYAISPLEDIKDCPNKCEGEYSYVDGKCVCNGDFNPNKYINKFERDIFFD